MGVNLNDLACFLPFNRTLTEDLTGKLNVQVIGGGNTDEEGDDVYIGIRKSHYSKDFKNLFLFNPYTINGITICLKLGNSENWNFDNKDFTIQCWFKANCYMHYVNNNQTHYTSLFASESDGYLAIGDIAAGIRYHIRNAANSGWHSQYASSRGVTYGKWYHIAMVRKGTVLYGFQNGVKTLQTDVGTAVVNRPVEPFYIGRWGASYFGGDFNMAEFIVDIGHAWWTDNFTPQSFLDNKLLNNISLGE